MAGKLLVSHDDHKGGSAHHHTVFAHHMLCQQALWWLSGGGMASRSRWCTWSREVSDAAVRAPASPKSVQLSPCIHKSLPPRVLPRFNPCLWGARLHWASCCQQPPVTALSAIPLIIAQRSPCVEPNRGVLGVNGAKTSEESPLEDNKKTAD